MSDTRTGHTLVQAVEWYIEKRDDDRYSAEWLGNALRSSDILDAVLAALVGGGEVTR